MSPLVSVVIPSFNHAQYIGKAIESVTAQTYSQWELIVIDDGSVDNTKAMLAPYTSDPRIKVIINSENKGQGFVVNQALSLVKGTFVCFLPSDDWYLPEKLELQINKFKDCDNSVGVVYGRGARFFESTGQIVTVELPVFRGWVLSSLIEHGNFVYPITPMFRRSCFDEIRFDESYRAEGEAIYLKIARRYKFEYINETIGIMRDHGYNTGKRREMLFIDNLRYWSEFFDEADLPAPIKKMRFIPISRLYRMNGLEMIAREMKYVEGRRLLFKAIFVSPRLIFDLRITGAIVISLLPQSTVKKILSKARTLGWISD